MLMRFAPYSSSRFRPAKSNIEFPAFELNYGLLILMGLTVTDQIEEPPEELLLGRRIVACSANMKLPGLFAS